MKESKEVESADEYNKRFSAFLSATETARKNSERCRDYYDHKQWTEDEQKKLARRRQAPIVVNRIQPKVEALKGLVINQRTDPKAYPRTKKHEQASYAITDALRYVNDNTDFDSTEELVCENLFIEGTAACIIEIERTANGIEIVANHIPWDRFYYDYHSRKLDYSDAKYMGIVIWSDLDDAIAMFPEYESELTELCNNFNSETETYEDKPTWVDMTRKRVRICQEYCLEDGSWEETFYTYNLVLQSGPSPYVDEHGEPVCPIVGMSAFCDRELNRYGPVHIWLDLQDEINHRRSKALHLLSQRQTASRRGAINDIADMKRELAKPDGHIEYNGEITDFQVLPTGDMAQAQFNLLAEAKSELDAISVNAQLSGERQGNLSGKAVQSLQAGGMLELSPLMSRVKHWKRECFRQIWYRIKQFWREEKWIRVTDDYKTLRWIGLNNKVTVADALQEKIQDESLATEVRQQAAQLLQMMAQSQDPRLNTVIEVKNDVAELEIDIILDMSPDEITIQDEQFQLLAQFAASRPEVPFSALLKLSRIRDKDMILEELEKAQEQAAQMQQTQAQIGMAKAQTDIENKQADTAVKSTKAQQTQLETMLLAANPVPVTSVAV